MPAGYAFAVLPLARPMTRSSAFMKVAAGAEMNSGLCTATYGRLSGFDSCAITIADPNRATVPTSASATTEDFIDRPSYLLARPFVEHQCPAGLAMLVSCEHLGQTTDEIRSRQPLRGCQRQCEAERGVGRARVERGSLRIPRQRFGGASAAAKDIAQPDSRLRVRRVGAHRRVQMCKRVSGPAVCRQHHPKAVMGFGEC